MLENIGSAQRFSRVSLHSLAGHKDFKKKHGFWQMLVRGMSYFLQTIVFVFVFCCACQCFQSSPWESLCPARVFSACLSKVAKFCNRTHHLKINYLLDSFSRKWISVLESHRFPDLETICLLVSLRLDGNMYQNPSIEKEFHIRIPRVRKEFSIRGLCFRRDSALESLIKKRSCPPEPVIFNRTSY